MSGEKRTLAPLSLLGGLADKTSSRHSAFRKCGLICSSLGDEDRLGPFVLQHSRKPQRRKQGSGRARQNKPRRGQRAQRGNDSDAGNHYEHDTFYGSSGASTTRSDDEDDSSGDDGPDPWADVLCETFRKQYLVYLAETSSAEVRPVSERLGLSFCRHCFSETVVPTGGSRTVLLINSSNPALVAVPVYRCDSPSGDCGRLQHMPLLEVGYFPSTLSKALDLTAQQQTPAPLAFFHVDLLRSLCSLQNHAPGMSTKAWCEHFCECAEYGIIARPRLERLLGTTLERFRHLHDITFSMAGCGIPDYPGEVPLFGSCPVCAETVDPVKNLPDLWPDATIDIEADGCMSFVRYAKAAPVANALRTKPFVTGSIFPVSAADGAGMFPGLDPCVPRGAKEGCEWIYGLIKDGKNTEMPATTCSRFAAAKEDTPIKDPDTGQTFDHTGLMGCFCRHHHFVAGCFMNSGEKYAYAAYLLIIIALMYPQCRIRNVTYDIGPCLWGPWFDAFLVIVNVLPFLHKVIVVLGCVQYLMAPFHRNDHRAPCQIGHATALKEGAGVQHGEAPEQKWSVAGRQASRQKGMSLANRHTSQAVFWKMLNKQQRVNHPWLLCQFRYHLTRQIDEWTADVDAITARVQASILRGVLPIEDAAAGGGTAIDVFRRTGLALNKVLSSTSAEAGAGTRDGFSVSAHYAMACLQAGLVRGPVSGGDFGISKDVLFNHYRGRVPEPTAGVIVVPKNNAGQAQLKKQLARLEKELHLAEPWDITSEGDFLPALEELRSFLVAEVESALDDRMALFAIMADRLKESLSPGARSRQETVVNSSRKVVGKLYDRLVAWRGSSFLGLKAMAPEKFEGDWSKDGVIEGRKAPWRSSTSASAAPEGERPQVLGRLLILAEGQLQRGREEEAKLKLEFEVTLRHFAKCVASLAAREKALEENIAELLEVPPPSSPHSMRRVSCSGDINSPIIELGECPQSGAFPPVVGDLSEQLQRLQAILSEYEHLPPDGAEEVLEMISELKLWAKRTAEVQPGQVEEMEMSVSTSVDPSEDEKRKAVARSRYLAVVEAGKLSIVRRMKAEELRVFSDARRRFDEAAALFFVKKPANRRKSERKKERKKERKNKQLLRENKESNGGGGGGVVAVDEYDD